MYWAKKILEWTVSPAYALATAQYFNDRYAYDGNDPNGFVGVGWSIMGIHDMGWSVVCYYVCVLMLRFIQWLLSLTSCLVVYLRKERPIFGKIRFMNYAGCKRKFKVDQFVARYKGAAENAAKAGGKKVSASTKVSGKKRKA